MKLSMKRVARPRAGPDGSLAAVWLLWMLVAVAIVVTYARVPAADLYHTSGSGIAAGFGRALVFLNFPVSLVMIAVAVLAAERLLATGAPWRWVGPTAGAAIILCATTAGPGVVDQDDLDARPINALPAIGIALAALLTWAASRRPTQRAQAPLSVGERSARAAASIVLVAIGIPWIAAELGFYLSGLPLIGDHVLSDELLPEADGSMLAAVHLGHHHGFDGVLIALSAMLLWPELGRMRPNLGRAAVSLYVTLLFTYGVVNAAQDAWFEQLVKRGSTAWELPSVLRPSAGLAWLGMLLGGLLLWLIVVRPSIARHDRSDDARELPEHRASPSAQVPRPRTGPPRR